jgi:2-amino-4-hydroxy-6-hydroxymethyldihydropteridine diphosphokinase
LTTVYLALGSNLGDRAAHLRRAIAELNSPDLRITRISPVYETAPQGLLDQGWFLNLVVEAQTDLLPGPLLRRGQRVERLLKRQRSVADGPRTIDVDVIFYGTAVIHSKWLHVPHPRYAERRFVLQPLADLVPHLEDPATGETVLRMLDRVKLQKIQLTAIVITCG